MAGLQAAVVSATVLLAQTATGPSTGTNIVDLGGWSREVNVYLTWAVGSAAGQVVVETSDANPYTGTWSPIAVLNFITADVKNNVAFTGCFRFIRVRVASAITGGSVTATIFAN